MFNTHVSVDNVDVEIEQPPHDEKRKLTVRDAVNGAPWRHLWNWLLDAEHSSKIAPELRTEDVPPEQLERDPE